MRYIKIEFNNFKRVFRCELLHKGKYNAVLSGEIVSQDTILLKEVSDAFSTDQISTDFYSFEFDDNLEQWCGIYRTSGCDGKSDLFQAIKTEVNKLNWNI